MDAPTQTHARDELRARLTEALLAELTPKKAGTFSFDGIGWDPERPILYLTGDHSTPDLRIEFFKGSARLMPVEITSTVTRPWTAIVTPLSPYAMSVDVPTYQDLTRVAQTLVGTMSVILIRAGRL